MAVHSTYTVGKYHGRYLYHRRRWRILQRHDVDYDNLVVPLPPKATPIFMVGDPTAAIFGTMLRASCSDLAVTDAKSGRQRRHERRLHAVSSEKNGNASTLAV